MRKSAAIFAGILLLLTVCASGILAATFFFQGFETDTTGWFNFSNGSIIGVPSGYTNGGGYANGVSSSSGSFHSRLRINPTDPDNPTCSPGPPTASALSLSGVAMSRFSQNPAT
jgi:hypothetical protein